MFVRLRSKVVYNTFTNTFLKTYASKPPGKPTGLAAKQFEKQMSKKIVIEDEEPEKLFSDLNIPDSLTSPLLYMHVPTIAILLNSYTNEYFTAGFTNGICNAYDWIGFTFVALGGAYYGLLTRNNFKKINPIIANPRTFYTVGAFPIFAACASSLMIYNFNLFSWAPLTAFFMINLFFDAKATERSLTPRYWMTYKSRFTLLSMFFLFVTSISLLTFQDYVSQLEDMLATYRDKSDPEAAARTLALGPTEKQFRSFSKTPLEMKLEQRRKEIEKLADPSK